MKCFKFTMLIALFPLWVTPILGYSQIPYLKKQGTATQLIVNQKPFLILGGELGNSSASSLDYMNQIWPTLEQLHLNTLLVPVYWELIEPVEDTFDFSLIDSIVNQSRERHMKLIFLWFGSWKNSMSCYAPGWVKLDTKRFPRALNKNGIPVEILSPFSKNNLEADKKAFVRFMSHLRDIDSKENTVIMIQVENEIGMLPDARDFSPEATRLMSEKVPATLMQYLDKNQKTITPEIRRIWNAHGNKSQGTWVEVFGESASCEEIFMAWHFAQFTQELVKSGKEAYQLPMFVNSALNREGYAPGEYPSAGPLPHLMDVWKAGAPNLDLLTPDIYFPNFEYWCRLYHKQDNPLFIPEARLEASAGVKMFYAIGNHDALGFSPFSIESVSHPSETPVVKCYALMHQLEPLILKHQGTSQMAGFRLTKDQFADTVVLGGYQLVVKHDFTLGWHPDAQKDQWPETGGIIICTGPGEYWVAGTGLVITFHYNGKDQAGIYQINEGTFNNQSEWIPERRMNGDQSHQGRHLRIPVDDYSIQQLKLYKY